jgi:hypothetical protein
VAPRTGEPGAVAPQTRASAAEITLQSEDGSKERHIYFIDHPQLTAGIHPTLLPVSRIEGDQASLARLIVCEAPEAPIEANLVLLSPDVDSDHLTAWIWNKGKGAPTVSQIEAFPATLMIGEEQVTIKQHWAHAHRQIKWQQREDSGIEAKQPALLIESGNHFHAKQFVLIQGKVTPCRPADDMIMLRYQ